MVKAIAVTTIALFLVGATASGQIIVLDSIVQQQQVFPGQGLHTITSDINIGGVNAVGTADEDLDVNLPQGPTTANSGLIEADQQIEEDLDQNGYAHTQGAASMRVVQYTDAQTIGIGGFITTPGQSQLIEPDGDAQESEGFQVVGSQSLTKTTGGPADANGVNTFDTDLNQNLGGNGTQASEAIGIWGTQDSSLSGANNGSGTVTTGINVNVGQLQKIGI